MLTKDQSPPNILNWTSADSMSFLANQIGLDADSDFDSHWLKFLVLIGCCVLAVLFLIRPECEWQIQNSWTVKPVRLVFAGHFLVSLVFSLLKFLFLKEFLIGQPIRVQYLLLWKNDEGRELDNISFSFLGPSGVKGRLSGDKIGVWSGVTGTLLLILAF